MHWNSFADFLAMGGYAGYVWGSVGVTAALLTVEPLLVASSRRRTIAQLKRQFRADRQDLTSPTA